MTRDDIPGLDWDKGGGLLPVIVQDALSGQVLMTGFVNRAALEAMFTDGEVTLFSRTRQRLWRKGETSGNRIAVESIASDCDRDALLVLGRPSGPACHTGAPSCFDAALPQAAGIAFLAELERTITQRIATPVPGSYTAALVADGPRRMAQKVGEEAVEVVIASSSSDAELLSESADLLFHLMVLLRSRGLGLAQLARELAGRQRPQAPGELPPGPGTPGRS